jgi:perosamine synthetase
VHLYGDPSAIDEINELSNTHSSTLIEDVLSLMGCFTLYASKVLTCGECGAIATNFDYLAEKLKMIRNHAMFDGYDTSVFSLNLMLPELSAAVAKVQTKKAAKNARIEKKKYLVNVRNVVSTCFILIVHP